MVTRALGWLLLHRVEDLFAVPSHLAVQNNNMPRGLQLREPVLLSNTDMWHGMMGICMVSGGFCVPESSVGVPRGCKGHVGTSEDTRAIKKLEQISRIRLPAAHLQPV